jgi:hypothetical protein
MVEIVNNSSAATIPSNYLVIASVIISERIVILYIQNAVLYPSIFNANLRKGELKFWIFRCD